MTSSDAVRSRRLVRARGVLLAAGVLACVAVGGVTLRASAGPKPSGTARPVVGAVVRQMRPATGNAAVPQCFVSSAPCTSANPTVAFAAYGFDGATGCVFSQNTTWGDGTPDTTMTYVGTPQGVPMATFTHAYAAPGNFTITYTIVVTDNPNGTCAGTTGQLDFTLSAPPALPCKSSQVTVPATTVPVSLADGPLSVTYGPMQLTFRPGVTGSGEQCGMQPAAGALPIDLEIPNVLTPIQLGESDATATIGLFAASSPTVSAIPNCDFSSLQALTNPLITPPLTDFAGTNNCLLTPTHHSSWDVIARWTVPGIVQMAHVQATNSDTAIYTTRPLTYYVDLDTMPPPQQGQTTMSALVDFIYSTLTENLPAIDRIALIQGTSAHLLVTNPFGREIGLDRRNRTHSFAGVGYAEAGGRSIAWILEPVLGPYQVRARATPGSRFNVDVADLQFLGHGTAPLIENFTWTGTTGSSGIAEKVFRVHGTALAPVVTPHASNTTVTPLTAVRFTLTGSVIPLGTAHVLWQFGDGATAVGRPAVHKYQKAGRYLPTVTVTDGAGVTVTVKMPVIVVKS